MPLSPQHKKAILLSLLILLVSAAFKFYTGSFLTMNEQSKREITKYEMWKRNQEVTLFSLRQSCVDIDKLGASLKNQTLQNENSKINRLIDSQTPNDSVVFILITKALETSTFNETKPLDSNQRITWIYHLNESEKVDSFALVFEWMNEDYLIKDVLRMDNYLEAMMD